MFVLTRADQYLAHDSSPSTTGTTSTAGCPRSVSALVSYSSILHLIHLIVYLTLYLGHVYNNYYLNSSDGINTRDGAQLLVENNVFSGISKPLYSTDAGYAVAKGNDFGGGSNTALVGTISSVPYSYSLLAASAVKAAVVGSAGPTLSF